VHAVCDGDGRWFANLHASTYPPRAHADVALARGTTLRWADDAPLVLGGDFNVLRPDVPGFVRAGSHHVDHVFARGLEVAAPAVVLERGDLSDHAPLVVTLAAR
jgi:endonuclease/exonuclease/phosphatase family metal-dependent hydrolase